MDRCNGYKDNFMKKECENKIIQKFANLLTQKIYDCFYLETQLENLDKILLDKDKEIERLKNILDKNGISYEDKEGKNEPKQE